jgi:creatinine amidohydrolase
MKKYYEPEKVALHVPHEEIPDEVRAMYLRPGELLAIQERFPVAYQPLGTIEWHGRHNPLGCDSIKAEELCIQAARQTGGVVMPPIHFAADAYWDCGEGVGYGMDATAGFQLPGSFYQTETDLFKKWLHSACLNYLNRGFRLVILISGHNPPIQQNVMDEVCYLLKKQDGKEPVVATMEYKLIPEGNARRTGDHAGGYETSMMLHLCNDRVNMDANSGMSLPKLGVGDGKQLTLEEASAKEGQIRFEMQVAGLVKFAKQRLSNLG